MKKKKILLTERQEQILKLITKGQSNSEIASSLDISLHTVKWHIQVLYKKLGKNVTREKIKGMKLVTLENK